MATVARRPVILVAILNTNVSYCEEELRLIVARYRFRPLSQFGEGITQYFPLKERELTTLIKAFTHLDNLSISGIGFLRKMHLHMQRAAVPSRRPEPKIPVFHLCNFQQSVDIPMCQRIY
jgi:hypothetical protein